MKRIIVLGSTGSIGTTTLNVIRDFKDKFKVVGLSTKGNIKTLSFQIEEFRPEAVAICDRDAKGLLNEKKHSCKVFLGEQSLTELVTYLDADIVVVATVGFSGLKPCIRAIEKGMQIALANKEVLVTAGDIVMKKIKESGKKILPIDSEQNAIFQCLVGNENAEIKRIILTASGGPFRESSLEEIKSATISQTLNHPTWNMGKKITVDSATLMNKGFEVIEAYHLFGVPPEKIEVVIHPQSVLHSMVEFVDGSIIAMMGQTNMYIPIQYVLSYPERWQTPLEPLNLVRLSQFTFEAPDLERFPCLKYAYLAVKAGGTMPTVLNAANEITVSEFLNEKIPLFEIPSIISTVMEKHEIIPNPTLDDIFEADKWAREVTKELCKKRK
jgi:1-deoxy-D-xylulose-5-phosphate reductoisomerase